MKERTEQAIPPSRWAVICGEAQAVLSGYPDHCVDAAVLDPPSGKNMMNMQWDRFAPPPDDETVAPLKGAARANQRQRRAFVAAMVPIFQQLLRVLKPGGFGVVWAFAHTAHWTALALEDAGFLVVHRIVHVQAQGLPKQGRTDKRLVKAGGAHGEGGGAHPSPLPAELAAALNGRGGQLKPSHEDWILVMKPYAEIDSAEIAELTGWSHWHDRKALSSPKQTRRYRDQGFAPLPGGRYVLETRKALRPDAESVTLLHHAGGVAELARAPYAPWSLCNAEANAVKYGGGLRIDQSRIPVLGERPEREALAQRDTNVYSFGGGSTATGSTGLGRYPGDLLLSHAPGCVCVGEAKVQASAPTPGGVYAEDTPNYSFTATYGHPNFGDADGKERVALWQCVPGCPVAAVDAQGGWVVSNIYGKPTNDDDHTWGGTLQHRDEPRGYTDEGPISRYFVTVDGDGEPEPLPDELQAALAEDLATDLADRFAEADSLAPVYSSKIMRSGRWGWCKTCGVPVSSLALKPHTGHDMIFHLAQKPRTLIDSLVRLVAAPGELVVDCFAGTGTVGESAIEQGCRFLGVEQDPQWARVAQTRCALQSATARGGQKRPGWGWSPQTKEVADVAAD